jgi:uncharacterized membrane protein
MRVLLSISPPLVLIAATGWLAANRSELPERWPIHWGLDGQPDGWATPSSAFFPLVVGFLIWAVLEFMARRMERHTYPNLDSKSSTVYGEARADLFRSINLAVSFVMAAIGGFLPFHTTSTTSPHFSLILVLSLFACIGLSVFVFHYRVGDLKFPPGYNALVYSDPNDSRILVPKISGSGKTLNLAHTTAKLILITALALPLGVLASMLFN